MPVVDMLTASAETVEPGPGPAPCASVAESERILAWLERPATRLVRIDAVWACPARGAARWRPLLEQVDAGRHAPDPFGDDRLLRTRARPARASA